MKSLLFLLLLAQQNTPVATPYKPSGIYYVGEKVGWTITGPAGKVPYTIKKNNQVLVGEGQLDLTSGKASLEVISDEPTMFFVQLRPTGLKPVDLGAAVAPTELKAVEPRPRDFDLFWQRKIEELHQIPENPMLTAGPSNKEGVDYATIKMDHVRGTNVYGQLAKPSKPGKYPAMLILQWASPPYRLWSPWVVDRAAEGWLALNVEPHSVLPTEAQSYYDKLPDALKNYTGINQQDRETNYFVEMYLRGVRAVDYLSKRPDWDGKTLLVMGTSMGGQQSLAVAGLHPKVTHMIVNVPAGCDLNAALHGRQEGYPNYPWRDRKAMEVARYIDCVNFAPNIKATSLVAMGFVDTACPPAGIWTAYNLIKGPKEVAPMPDSPHNHLATAAQQMPYTKRSTEWLNSLVKTGKVPPMKPGYHEEAVARTDQNSMVAHQELVQKARSGKIDLYFLGDSITRRWGTSDPQYKEFLAHWNANFFGWNAANFGWGADTTRNILWRIQNGELDNVHPRAIVLLAGTNDIGSGAPSAAVISRTQAILATLREKAPKAKVILTAIFPRNDNPRFLSVIEQTNAGLGKLADGQRVLYLDVNDKLAGADGQLRDGMAVDGLHLGIPGYQVWADGLTPLLSDILGPRAPNDSAPAPTGDPSLRQKAKTSKH
ncbi:MAG TPA: GDSL-type esterase/lipase family protein [Fimbriimonas sp.]|nr:GDSL-type esterase/lipase family protein [Fimbriimonas sp.]